MTSPEQSEDLTADDHLAEQTDNGLRFPQDPELAQPSQDPAAVPDTTVLPDGTAAPIPGADQ